MATLGLTTSCVEMLNRELASSVFNAYVLAYAISGLTVLVLIRTNHQGIAGFGFQLDKFVLKTTHSHLMRVL